MEPARIKLGERITTRARLISTSKTAQRLVIDYAVHYPKKNGVSRKVFKLKETELAPGAGCDLAISQTVKDFTTRKHNAGFHRVELMVNGEAVADKRLRTRDPGLMAQSTARPSAARSPRTTGIP